MSIATAIRNHCSSSLARIWTDSVAATREMALSRPWLRMGILHMLLEFIVPSKRSTTFAAFESLRKDMFGLNVSPQGCVAGEGTSIGASHPFTSHLTVLEC